MYLCYVCTGRFEAQMKLEINEMLAFTKMSLKSLEKHFYLQRFVNKQLKMQLNFFCRKWFEKQEVWLDFALL